MHGGKPQVQLQAHAVDGAAHLALIALVAQRCGVTRARVRIIHGQTSRTKQLDIEGLDDTAVLQALLGR